MQESTTIRFLDHPLMGVMKHRTGRTACTGPKCRPFLGKNN